MDKYAEYLDDADDASGESTKMMREAMAHTQVRHGVGVVVWFGVVRGDVLSLEQQEGLRCLLQFMAHARPHARTHSRHEVLVAEYSAGL